MQGKKQKRIVYIGTKFGNDHKMKCELYSSTPKKEKVSFGKLIVKNFKKFTTNN